MGSIASFGCYFRINRIRDLGSDSGDKARDVVKAFATLVHEAIQIQRRLKPEVEERLLKYPDLAIEYAAEMFGERWLMFEQNILVSDLSASLAVEYAIRCRKERWFRFENKIKHSVVPLARYREAFPGLDTYD